MRVGDIVELLSGFNPNDDVLLFSSSHKVGHITGLDTRLMNMKGAVVLTYDYDDVIQHKESVEESINKQIAQLEELKQNINRKAIFQELEAKGKIKVSATEVKLIKQEKRRQSGKVIKKTIKTRTAIEQLCDGFIPTGKRGRPRKIDVSLLSDGIRGLLKPDKISDMTSDELKKFIIDINGEIDKHGL